MVHLLAAIANDAEYMPAFLHAARELAPAPAAAPGDEAWGVGYFADGRALIVRKPGALLEDRSSYGVTPDLRSHVVLTCAQRNSMQVEAPPFRFRGWLFGGVGGLSEAGRLQASVASKMPSFLQDLLVDPRGGRLAQAMFLAELHRAGVLEDPLAPPERAAEALSTAIETMARLGPEVGCDALEGVFVATQGRALLVLPFGRPVFTRTVQGLERLPDGPVDETLNDFKRVAEGLRRFKAEVVATGREEDPSWSPLPDRVTTIIRHRAG